MWRMMRTTARSSFTPSTRSRCFWQTYQAARLRVLIDGEDGCPNWSGGVLLDQDAQPPA